ncbi:hypothetical protein JYU34_002052 [Plutella xylostella]|uniref:Uncharacterized protein n=1 Tax=Plutella xylostella TaxID=51655 RepID=A0ABQ7R5F0_PLUXY|nr:hypothetical protein JYU34_002052 [Plutella xylostella]
MSRVPFPWFLYECRGGHGAGARGHGPDILSVRMRQRSADCFGENEFCSQR